MSVILFTAFIAAVLYRTTPMGAEESFRKAFFQVASLHTSTGFVTADYMQWVPVLWGTLTVIMLIGACAGSTTGGMKCIRMVILAKVSRNEFKHIVHPNAVLPVRVNNEQLDSARVVFYKELKDRVKSLSLYDAILEVNHWCHEKAVGPGLGSCGPAYSWDGLPDLAKWLLSFLMLLGRLELFTVLLLFSSDFWKRN